MMNNNDTTQLSDGAQRHRHHHHRRHHDGHHRRYDVAHETGHHHHHQKHQKSKSRAHQPCNDTQEHEAANQTPAALEVNDNNTCPPQEQYSSSNETTKTIMEKKAARIFVPTQTIDNEGPPQSTLFFKSQEHKQKRGTLQAMKHASPQVSSPIPDRLDLSQVDMSPNLPNPRPSLAQSLDNGNFQNSQSRRPPPKNQVWRNLQNYFRSPNIVPVEEAEASTPGVSAPGALSSNVQATMDDNRSNGPDDNHYVIPMATLVVEEKDVARYKQKHLIATAVTAFVVAIIIGVAVGASRKPKPESQDDEGKKRLSAEETHMLNDYNVWIPWHKMGEGVLYLGAQCNSLRTACSKCGLYIAMLDEVVGECSACQMCPGGIASGFEADCTGYGQGKFTCSFLNETQHMPEGLNYSHWYCPYEIGGKAICEGYDDCNNMGTGCKKCGIFEVDIDTNQVTGSCSSCNVCATGGLNADCTNIGMGRFDCFLPENGQRL